MLGKGHDLLYEGTSVLLTYMVSIMYLIAIGFWDRNMNDLNVLLED